MNKRIVHYKGRYTIMDGRAYLYPVDHPDSERVSNTRLVTTSVVISHDGDTGIVETQNTIYHPVKELP